MRRLFGNRYARRLAAAVVTLALLDPLVPGVVARAERVRYESVQSFRFENSDLFALGPIVEYFREHPKGEGPRVVFLGDSVVWGYWIRATETVPAQLQRLVPDERVFNFGINGFGAASDLLITKAIIDSVDTVYLFDMEQEVNPLLPSLIPITDPDLKRFHLDRPNQLESRLRRWAGIWNLYRYSYRLQAAWFGMSTRLYVYLNKSQLARAPLRAIRREPPPGVPAAVAEGPVPPGVVVTAPRAAAPLTEERAVQLATAYPWQWNFGTLIQVHGKEAVVVELDGHCVVESERDLADLNSAFNPAVQFVRLSVPKELRPDTTHFSPEGARAVAHALLSFRQASRVKR